MNAAPHFSILFQMLSIGNVTQINHGYYQCLVTDNADTLISSQLWKLNVMASSTHSLSGPYFIYVSPDQRVSPRRSRKGSSKLKCIAGGNPQPQMAWILNGKVLVSFVRLVCC